MRRLLSVAFMCAATSSSLAAINPLYEPFDYASPGTLSGTVSAGPPVTSLGQVNDNQTPGDASDDRQWYSTGGTTGIDFPLIASGNLSTPAGLAAGHTAGSNSVSWGGQGVSSRIAVGSLGTGETAYYSVVLNITNIANTQLRPYVENESSGANHNWLFGFTSSAGPATSAPGTGGARVYARQGPLVDGIATTYQLGFTRNSINNVEVSWENVFRLPDEPVFVVAKYENVSGTLNDNATMWVNPSAFGGAEPLTGGISNAFGNDIGVASFLIRQTGAGTSGASNSSVVIDELRVGTTWASVTPVPEPAATALLTCAMATLSRRRRT